MPQLDIDIVRLLTLIFSTLSIFANIILYLVLVALPKKRAKNPGNPSFTSNPGNGLVDLKLLRDELRGCKEHRAEAYQGFRGEFQSLRSVLVSHGDRLAALERVRHP